MDSSNVEISVEEEAIEAELRKGMSGNTKLSHWVGAFSKASDVVRRAVKPHYAVKPLYFCLAIKISTKVSFVGKIHVCITYKIYTVKN